MNSEMFIRTLLVEFSKFNLKEINIEELDRKLYPYTLKDEYKSLFDNINMQEKDKEVDLSDILTEEEKKGYIQIIDGKMFINPLIDCLNRINNEEQLKLIDKIVREIVSRHTLENSYFNIYGLDPNQDYLCYHNGFYSCGLYTDGLITKISEEILGTPKEKILAFFHQTECDKKMKLKVVQASYVALVDYSPNYALYKLYTEILDRKILLMLKNSLMQDESVELLKDKSIRVRKLKI